MDERKNTKQITMPQQTAVEWLIMQLPVGIRVELYEKNIHVQALKMEKEQIIDSYGIGHNDGCAYMTDGKTEFEGSEQYYNETYGEK